MGTLPIHTIAGTADPIFIVALPDFRWESMINECLLDRRQFTVAAQASLKGGDRCKEIEPSENLNDLWKGDELPHTVPLGHDAAFEQAAIPGQKDPPLLA